MTRAQLLRLLVGQARLHGFQFRKWFAGSSGIPWSGAEDAITWLARGDRARMLVFSHDFARAFFRSGDRVTFLVPEQHFQRVTPSGSTRNVERKAHLRRSSRDDTWKFHLREMAAAAEPLRYIRRYLLTEETVAEAKFQPESESARAPANDEEANYDDEGLVRDAG